MAVGSTTTVYRGLKAFPNARNHPRSLILGLARCARMLFLFSQGETPDAHAAGNAARQAARVLEQYGLDEDWFHLADPRESVPSDDFAAVFTEGMVA